MEGLNPIEWAVRPLKKYAVFSGRAPRAEYWWYALIFGSLGGLLGLLDVKMATPIIGRYGPLALASMLIFTLPGLALYVRRLHDIDRSAWWLLLNAWSYALIVLQMMGIEFAALLKNIPTAVAVLVVLGMLGCLITILIFTVTPGTEGSNRYGPDPYGPDSLEEVFA